MKPDPSPCKIGKAIPVSDPIKLTLPQLQF